MTPVSDVVGTTSDAWVPAVAVERARFASHHRRMKSTLVALFVMSLAGSAAAQSGEPTFDSLSMGRHTPLTTLSFELGYEVWDEPGNSDITVIPMNIAGHFIGETGLGGYFVLPLTYLDIENLVFQDSGMALGNIELGGIYTKFMGRTALVFHGGVALPTAQDDDIAGAQGLGSFTRLADVPLRTLDSTWLRLGFSPMGRGGNFVWRADVGIDLALDEDNSDYSPIFHVNVGGGFDLGSALLLAELVNVFTDDDAADDDGSTFTIGARFLSGNLRPGVGLLFPIDLDGFDDFEWALLGSLAVRL